MRKFVDVGLLVLVGAAMLAACGDDKVSSGGGSGGRSTTVSTGGAGAVGGGGAAAATGGAGGKTTVGAGGSTVGHGGSATGGAGGGSAGGAGGSASGTVDAMPEPAVEPGSDAAIDASDAADVPQIPDGSPLDTTLIDAGGIDGIGSPIDGTGMLRGYLVFANEMMAFEACATTNLAWANLQGSESGRELLPDLGPYCVTTDAGPAPCPGTIYVELVGNIVSGGKYGHMNKYASQLTVSRYLVASKTGLADCPFLEPVYPN